MTSRVRPFPTPHLGLPPADEEFRTKLTFVNKLVKFGHDHSVAMKVVLIASAVFAGIAIAGIIVGSLIFAPAIIAISAVGLGITTTGLVFGVLNAIAAKKAGVSAHDMANHTYPLEDVEMASEKTGDMVIAARMTYQGNVPVVILNYEECSHEDVGRAQGKMFADQIIILLDAYREMDAFQLLEEKMLSDTGKTLIKKMAMPKEYIDEMHGIVYGCNESFTERGVDRTIDVLDLYIMNLLPDAHSLVSGEDIDAVACTSVIEREVDGSLVLARNMDWYSAGVLGASQCMIQRVLPGGKRVMQVGIPGLVGAVTGVNSSGLAVAMNVCETKTHQFRMDGMPSTFKNRLILEDCDSMEEKRGMMITNPPLVPYHLAVTDGQKASVLHFGQGNRSLQAPGVTRDYYGNGPLVTTNRACFDTDLQQAFGESGEDRELEISKFYASEEEGDRGAARRALALPRVNNSGTTHTMVFSYSAEAKVPIMAVRFDNGFSGEGELHTVTFSQ